MAKSSVPWPCRPNSSSCIPARFRGATRDEGLQRAASAIAQAADGLDLQAGKLRILIENTAGSEFSLGGNFEQVAELIHLLRKHVPVGACIDTCHTHVAGYDIVSDAGFTATLDQLDRTVGLEQRARLALQRRQGRVRLASSTVTSTSGREPSGSKPFRRLLNDPRLAHAAFIAETPIDEPLDDLDNVNTLKRLVKSQPAPDNTKRKRTTAARK